MACRRFLVDGNIMISNSHLYTWAIFHASNAAWESEDAIEDHIKQFCPGYSYFESYRNDHAQAYYLQIGARSVIAINGTDGTMEDWGNNLTALADKYGHPGFRKEYYDDLSPWILKKAKYDVHHGNKILLCTHSQGTAEGNLAVLDINEKYRSYKPDVEQIGFGGPKSHTPAGLLRMASARCRVTHLKRSDDPITKIGGIRYKFPFKFQWTSHYGYQVKLPKTSINLRGDKAKWPKALTDLAGGHAWSSYMYSLAEWYSWAGKLGEIKVLKDIMKVAKI